MTDGQYYAYLRKDTLICELPELNNYHGAFASPLNLVAGGYRLGYGTLFGVGSSYAYGGYWSSSVSGSGARSLSFHSSYASMGSSDRVYGRSVRCTRDD